jgi:hypothetical protein
VDRQRGSGTPRRVAQGERRLSWASCRRPPKKEETLSAGEARKISAPFTVDRTMNEHNTKIHELKTSDNPLHSLMTEAAAEIRKQLEAASDSLWKIHFALSEAAVAAELLEVAARESSDPKVITAARLTSIDIEYLRQRITRVLKYRGSWCELFSAVEAAETLDTSTEAGA